MILEEIQVLLPFFAKGAATPFERRCVHLEICRSDELFSQLKVIEKCVWAVNREVVNFRKEELLNEILQRAQTQNSRCVSLWISKVCYFIFLKVFLLIGLAIYLVHGSEHLLIKQSDAVDQAMRISYAHKIPRKLKVTLTSKEKLSALLIALSALKFSVEPIGISGKEYFIDFANWIDLRSCVRLLMRSEFVEAVTAL